MARMKRGPATIGGAGWEPFASTAEAWFWGMAGYLARLDGGRPLPRPGRVMRPCEPGDVVYCAMRLARDRTLSTDQFRTLVAFGREGLAPDPRLPRQRSASTLWQAGLGVLDRVLRAKGIVA